MTPKNFEEPNCPFSIDWHKVVLAFSIPCLRRVGKNNKGEERARNNSMRTGRPTLVFCAMTVSLFFDVYTELRASDHDRATYTDLLTAQLAERSPVSHERLSSTLVFACNGPHEWLQLRLSQVILLENYHLKHSHISTSVRIQWGSDAPMRMTMTQRRSIDPFCFRNFRKAVRLVETHSAVRLELSLRGKGNVVFRHDLAGAKETIERVRLACETSERDVVQQNHGKPTRILDPNWILRWFSLLSVAIDIRSATYGVGVFVFPTILRARK